EAPWIGVLALQPAVMVLDALALAAGRALPQAQLQALPVAGLLVLNKSASLDTAARQTIIEALPSHSTYWTELAALPLDRLPGVETRAIDAVDNFVTPRTLAQLPAVWTDPMTPICLSQAQAQGWSIGWRWHPERVFDASKMRNWLQSLDWQRAKLVIHSQRGWISGNALDGGEFAWLASEWRKDSRVELIFSEPQDPGLLSAQLADCIV
ncbi:MAG TPA: cobalamin biosynthesis protein CobW, partial [Pseudomonas sp.]|nr:cobalamin biosynthesis protein CobW [Pseudomonas sp.]